MKAATHLLASLDVDVIKFVCFFQPITCGDANYSDHTSASCLREALLRLPGNRNQQEPAGGGARVLDPNGEIDPGVNPGSC